MKIRILGIVHDLGALAQIRVISPLSYLKQQGLIDFTILDLSRNKPPKITYVPDLVVVQRLDNFNLLGLLKMLKEKGSKIVYEVDDNLLNVPDKNIVHDYYNNPHVKRAMLETIWLSDHMIVTNNNLKRIFEKHIDSISVIPNQIDTEIFKPVHESKKVNGKIRIGYAGTMTHTEDFEQVLPALKKIQSEFKDKIQLVFINFIPDEFIEDINVEFIPGHSKLNEFADILEKANLDIGLAPLKFNEFNLGKSDIKFLEYGIKRIAGIYSKYAPYAGTVVEEKYGLFVESESSNEWYAKIKYLIENPQKITELQENAYRYVLENRTVKERVLMWYETFKRILDSKNVLAVRSNNTETSSDSGDSFENSVRTENEKCEKQNVDGVSIIVLTYNSSKTIEPLFESLKKTIGKNDEVIFVDNASKDGTVKKLKKLVKKNPQFKIFKNKTNLGFSAGCNVGIKKARNQFIVLLNPDTVVTDGWLKKMLKGFDDKQVAAVGPLSNYVAGYQNVKAYFNEDELRNLQTENVAKVIEQKFDGEFVETKLLIGFCMMIKKDVLDELGLLDENLFLGNDDLELSWRFRINGYKLLIAKDTFVFHEGQKSFQTVEPKITNRLVQESTDALYKKLTEYYGEGKVPEPMELWGINWFTPSNAKFLSAQHKEKSANLVSIIIPTFNNWKYTEECINSIRQYTNTDYELIVVDNASTDETIPQLKNYDKVKILKNETNLGFPKAINKGILNAKGNYIVIMNNDVVVTEGWLKRMLEIAGSDEKIGIVGPVSNAVSGVQLDKEAKYNTLDEMHKYAAKLKEKNEGKISEFPRVAFLCTLIKKEVIETIGGLDERFSPGNFEDDDFCLRSQLAGFKTVIAEDVFVHHYGSVSFKANGETEYAKRIEINKERFVDKWGSDPEGIWLRGEKLKSRNLNYPINDDLFVQHFERAFINIEDNEYLMAIENLEIALNYYSQSNRKNYENIKQEELYVLLGKIYTGISDFESAKENFEKALNLNPSSSQACAGLGEIFYLSEMFEEAKTMYEWAVINDVNNVEARQKLKEINITLKLPENHNSVLLESDTPEKIQSQG